MNTRLRSWCAPLSALAVLLAGAPAAFADAPPPGDVYFSRPPTAAGSGCLPGKWISSLSDEKDAFNVTFFDYFVNIDPGQNFQRKFCDLTVGMHFPQGWSFSITDVTYRGALQLDSVNRQPTSARENSVYSFYGVPGSVTFSSTWVGPIDDFGLPLPYEFTDTLGVNAVIWSPCGQNRDLKIKTDYTVRNNSAKTGHAYASADSIEGQVSTIYHIQWKRCVVSKSRRNARGTDNS